MNKTEIEKMLLDIINNHAKYKCKPTWYTEWKEYHLGDEIRNDFEYTKYVYYVVYINYEFRITNNPSRYISDIYFESESIEDCENWIKGNTYIVYINNGKYFIENHNRVICYEFKGSKEDCEKWVKKEIAKNRLKKENSKTWLDNEYPIMNTEQIRDAISNFCNKLINDMNENLPSYIDTGKVPFIEEFKSIIRSIGVKLDD